ncbi:MAG: metal ABC transporter substrate-binding protein [Oscillospiraceae bacterium]|nr:metal ABC transporter substrate-binding protein [Oscillospiraceae bacterium]
MNLKKVLLIMLLIAIIGAGVVVALIAVDRFDDEDDERLSVVVTNFVAYDFVRQIAGDNVNLTYLLGPGVEMHGYEPNPGDLRHIENADLFIYIGGDMERWTTRVLPELNIEDTTVLRLMDAVDVIEKQEVDGAEHHHHDHDDEEHGHSHEHSHHDEEEEHGHHEEEGRHHHEEVEYDEHIWTSLENAIVIVRAIADELIRLDSENEEIYEENATKYIEQIREVQTEIRQIVEDRVRDRLVFGDRMPMQYFLSEFGLIASAAFTGCGTQTEPSAGTITHLVNVVREQEIPVVLYIELSIGRIARTIASEANVEVMQIQTLHNVSRDDFEAGESYVSLMRRNLDVLRKALH